MRNKIQIEGCETWNLPTLFSGFQTTTDCVHFFLLVLKIISLILSRDRFDCSQPCYFSMHAKEKASEASLMHAEVIAFVAAARVTKFPGRVTILMVSTVCDAG